MNIKKILTEQDFIEMEALEKKFYSAEYIADYSNALSWYTEFPFTTVAAEDQGGIVGFLDLFPVSDSVFEQIKVGSFNDKNLQKNDIVDIRQKHDTPLNLFLSCIVIDETYRNSGILKMLLTAHATSYRDWMERGTDIDKIITDNVTTAGEKFSKKMGFEKLTESNHGTVVYMQSFKHFLEVLDKL